MGVCGSSTVSVDNEGNKDDDDNRNKKKKVTKIDREQQKQALEKEMETLRKMTTDGWGDQFMHTQTPTIGNENASFDLNNNLNEQLKNMGFNEYMIKQSLKYNKSNNLLELIEWIESHQMTKEEKENYQILTVSKRLKKIDVKPNRLQVLHALDEIKKNNPDNTDDNDIIDKCVNYLVTNVDIYNTLSYLIREEYMLRDQMLVATIESVQLNRKQSFEWNNRKPFIMAELRSMGFLQTIITKALHDRNVYNKKSAMRWIINNPLSVSEELNAKIDEIIHSGFVRNEAIIALNKFSNNLNNSIIWLNQGKPSKINNFIYNVKQQKCLKIFDDKLILNNKIEFNDPNQKWSLWDNGNIKSFHSNKLLCVQAKHSKKIQKNIQKKIKIIKKRKVIKMIKKIRKIKKIKQIQNLQINKSDNYQNIVNSNSNLMSINNGNNDNNIANVEIVYDNNKNGNSQSLHADEKDVPVPDPDPDDNNIDDDNPFSFSVDDDDDNKDDNPFLVQDGDDDNTDDDYVNPFSVSPSVDPDDNGMDNLNVMDDKDTNKDKDKGKDDDDDLKTFSLSQQSNGQIPNDFFDDIEISVIKKTNTDDDDIDVDDDKNKIDNNTCTQTTNDDVDVSEYEDEEYFEEEEVEEEYSSFIEVSDNDDDDDDNDNDLIDYNICCISSDDNKDNNKYIEYFSCWTINEIERTITMNIDNIDDKYLYLVYRNDKFMLDTRFHEYDMEQRWCIYSKIQLQELNPKELAKELDDPDAECIICFDNDPNIILNPCGHCNFCKECIDELKPDQCPICRTNIKSILTKK